MIYGTRGFADDKSAEFKAENPTPGLIVDGCLVQFTEVPVKPAIGDAPDHHAAMATWRSLDYQVRPVDCTSAYRHSGSLHCLVNVLRRARNVPSDWPT